MPATRGSASATLPRRAARDNLEARLYARAMATGLARRAFRGVTRRMSAVYRRLTALADPGVSRRFGAAAEHELGLLRDFWSQRGRTLPSDLEALERAWDAHTRAAFDPASSDAFYRSWQGETGYLNIVANVRDQLRRIELFRAYDRLLPAHALRAIDVGCGTAALTLQFAARFDELLLVDVDNLSSAYVRFKLEREGLTTGVRQLEPEALAAVADSSAEVVCCIDVLEHLTNPSQVFREQLDRVLRPGGLLFLQAPWGGGVPEHLAEAPVDWARKGGRALLERRYDRVAAISRLIELKPGCVSGVYRKR